MRAISTRLPGRSRISSAAIVLSEPAFVIPWLVIALFAGELVWKDRETGAAQIADAAPVRTSVVLSGRFLALVALIALFQLAFLIGGILLQVLHGYYDFEPGLYLRILFGWSLAEHVLLAAFAMTVHVLVNHKYVGHVVVLLATVFNSAALYGIHAGRSSGSVSGSRPRVRTSPREPRASPDSRSCSSPQSAVSSSSTRTC